MRSRLGRPHPRLQLSARNQAFALSIILAETALGCLVPNAEPWLPKVGLTYDAGTAQATLAAIAGAMITLAGFVITALTLVLQTVQSMSPRLVGALRHMGCPSHTPTRVSNLRWRSASLSAAGPASAESASPPTAPPRLALIRLSSCALGPGILVDRAGIARVAYPAPECVDFVSVALDETLLYGASSPQVVRRAHAVLDRAESIAPNERRAPLAARRALLTRISAATLPDAFLSDLAAVPDLFGLGGPG